MKKLKILGLGLLAFLGLTAFGNCDLVVKNYEEYIIPSWTCSAVDLMYNDQDGVCYFSISSYWNRASKYDSNGNQIATGNNYSLICGKGLKAKFCDGTSVSYYVYTGMFGNVECPTCPECEECPSVDTGAILSGYIAISDITTNYCVSNDLCPEMSGGNSAIYINDIRHESMPFINIWIPEEIQRDYNYTGNGTQLDINVEGYGYDQEKMQNMINTQFYKPTSEEMSGLIEKIADFLPLIAIALLIIRAWRVLKKVFRF